MFKRVHAFIGDNSGATAIEYALLASLIAVALIAALQSLNSKMSSVLNEVSSSLK